VKREGIRVEPALIGNKIPFPPSISLVTVAITVVTVTVFVNIWSDPVYVNTSVVVTVTEVVISGSEDVPEIPLGFDSEADAAAVELGKLGGVGALVSGSGMGEDCKGGVEFSFRKNGSTDARTATAPFIIWVTIFTPTNQGEADRGEVGWGWGESCKLPGQGPLGLLFSIIKGI